MQIDITKFVAEECPRDYSASRAEIGADAGPATWRAAIEASTDDDSMFIDTDEKREAFLRFVAESGGWSEEERAAWSHIEINALFIQWVSGDLRELELCVADDGSTDWAEYQRLSEAGTISSNLYRDAETGQIFFNLGL